MALTPKQVKPSKGRGKGKHPARDKLDIIGMDEICRRTAECESMRKIAADYGVSWASMQEYVSRTPERSEQYARAREAQADKFAEEIIQISDDGTRDTYIDADGNERTNQDVVARSRLRVDSRKWLASKMAPKKYGDKITNEHTGKDGAPIESIVSVTADWTGLRAKVAAKKK